MATRSFVVVLILCLVFFLVNNPLRCKAGNVLYNVGPMYPIQGLNYNVTQLALEEGGKLVLSGGNYTSTWLSYAGALNYNLTLEKNGMLVLYAGPPVDLPRDISYHQGPLGDYVLVVTDMHMGVYGPGKYVNGNETTVPLSPTDVDERAENVLSPNQTLPTGKSMNNGRWEVKMQDDCDLVLYDFGNKTWSTGTSGKGVGCHLKMETTGDAVVYNESGDQIWSSDTNGLGVSVLVLRNDGSLVVYGPVLWEYPLSSLSHKDSW